MKNIITPFTKRSFDKALKKEQWYYCNPDITEEHFPITTTQTENWKLIKMEKSFSSQDALDRMKSEGCRPATAYELLLFKQNHPDQFPGKTWTWVLAFGQTWKDSDGDHRVPSVGLDSGGDWGFYLDFFEVDWDAGACLLCFCDSQPSEPLALETDLEPLDPSALTDEQAITHLKANGYKITKEF